MYGSYVVLQTIYDRNHVVLEPAPVFCRNSPRLRYLTDEELDRQCMHSERGEESVRYIVKLLAAHDLVHLNQIERIKSAAAFF